MTRRTMPAAWAMILAVVIGLPALSVPASPAKNAVDELIGIRLGMTRDEVAVILKKLGTLEGSEGGPLGAKQFWELKSDPSYGWIALRYDDELRVQWMTAFARLDAKRHPVRYQDIGDPKQARKTGTYFYTWVLPGEKSDDAHAVTARGTDPEVLASISIYSMKPGD